MILDIILVNRIEEEISEKKIKEDFKKQLIFKDNKIFCKQLSFNYQFQKSTTKNNIRLKISTFKNGSSKNKAEEITMLKNKIKDGPHRKDYIIIIAYDGASEYYCSKLSRLISIFERKLRQFIYIVILAAYGNEWVEKTFSEDIKNDVDRKDNNKNRHIERALECFTFQNYIDYLFEKRTEVDPKKIIEDIIEIGKRDESTKDDILKILNKAQEVSLWEKLFGCDDIGLKDEIKKIREIRNVVMHNKEINNVEFDNYKKILRICNKKMETAILNIEKEKYFDIVNVDYIFYSLNETIQSIIRTNELLKKSFEPIINDIKRISTIINNSYNNAYNISKQFKIHNLVLRDNLTKSSLFNLNLNQINVNDKINTERVSKKNKKLENQEAKLNNNIEQKLNRNISNKNLDI